MNAVNIPESIDPLDCDDEDPSLGSILEDADCDGIVTAEDCDDSDYVNMNSSLNDLDCDGITNDLDVDSDGDEQDYDADVVSDTLDDDSNFYSR